MTVQLPSDRATGSSREILSALTHERVMRGIEQLFGTGGRALTFREVAAASGVPERTIYRRYATKEALLAAFWRWLNQDELGIPASMRSFDELLAQLPRTFAAFDRREALIRAMLHEPEGRALRRAQAATRRRELRDSLGDVLAGVAPRRATQLLAAVRLLCSAVGWEMMKDASDMSGAEAAAAASWAVRALVAQAREEAKPRAKRAARKTKPPGG